MGCIEASVLDLIMPIVIRLFLAVVRFLSIYKIIKCFYKIFGFLGFNITIINVDNKGTYLTFILTIIFDIYSFFFNL